MGHASSARASARDAGKGRSLIGRVHARARAPIARRPESEHGERIGHLLVIYGPAHIWIRDQLGPVTIANLRPLLGVQGRGPLRQLYYDAIDVGLRAGLKVLAEELPREVARLAALVPRRPARPGSLAETLRGRRPR